MPNYSRSHLGRFIRKMFAQEIERELRMLEEFVMTDEVSDDVGVSMMTRDENFEPPEVPFQPKPTSVSVAPVPPASASDFTSDSNFTTMPKVEREDIHAAPTMIFADGRGRSAPYPIVDEPPPARKARTQPPPPPPGRAQTARPKTGVPPIYDDDIHAQPTMIIDINRMRRRGRG